MRTIPGGYLGTRQINSQGLHEGYQFPYTAKELGINDGPAWQETEVDRDENEESPYNYEVVQIGTGQLHDPVEEGRKKLINASHSNICHAMFHSIKIY